VLVALGGGILVLAVLVVAPGTAIASPRAVAIRVDFDAPVGCSDAEAFRRGVAARLDRSADAELVATTRLQVRITRTADHVAGELRLLRAPDATDTRQVEGTSCDEVVGVLALTAALALQRPGAQPARAAPAREAPPTPRTVAREASPPAAAPARPRTPPASGAEAPRSTVAGVPAAPASPPPPPPNIDRAPPTTTAVVNTPTTTPEPAAPRTHIEIGAGAAVGRVLAPGLNLGGAVMLGVARERAGRLSLSLRLAWLYLPRDLLRPGDEVAASWAGVALTACPGWGMRRGGFEGQACARAIGGWIAASDRAVTNPRPAGRTWWGAGALLRGGVPIGAGFSIELEAGVDALLVERHFITTTPLRAVAETPPVSVLVGLGLSRRL
jgi:hypothetical protein